MQPGVRAGLEGVVFVVVAVEHGATEHRGSTRAEGDEPAKRNPQLSTWSHSHTKLHPRKFKLT